MGYWMTTMFNSPTSGKTSFFRCFLSKKWPLLLILFFSHAFPVRAADNLEPILQLILEEDDSAFHRDLLKGMRDGLAGRLNLSAPPSWKKVSAKLGKSPDAGVREEVRLLGLVFGDGRPTAVLFAHGVHQGVF